MLVKQDLYTRVFNELTPYCRRVIRDKGIVFCEDDTNECLQMVRLKVYEITEKFQANKLAFIEHDKLLKYCRTSIKNVVVDYNRSRFVVAIPVNKKDMYRYVNIDDCLQDEVLINADIDECERDEDFRKLMASLQESIDKFATRKQAMMLKEKYLHEKTTAELAEKFDVSALHVNKIIQSTMKSALTAARIKEIDPNDYF